MPVGGNRRPDICTSSNTDWCYNQEQGVHHDAIGKGGGSTKYALLSSISNIAVVYMTAFDGWLHDEYSVVVMLLGEALLGVVFVCVFLFILYRIETTLKHAAVATVTSSV